MSVSSEPSFFVVTLPSDDESADIFRRVGYLLEDRG